MEAEELISQIREVRTLLEEQPVMVCSDSDKKAVKKLSKLIVDIKEEMRRGGLFILKKGLTRE